jgi:cytochrome c biogenesis protein CcmG/thiol:disulfide interchange protein DsbE
VKRALQLGALGVLGGLIGLLGWQLIHHPGHNFALAVDRGHDPAAPAFDLPRLGAPGKVSLASFHGRPTVINFWASWCVGCKDEAANLDQLARRWQPRGVAFVGIDAEDLGGDAQAFARRFDVRYLLLHDTHTVKDDYGVTKYPETFVIDRHGRATAHFAGPIVRADGVDLVRSLNQAIDRAVRS